MFITSHIQQGDRFLDAQFLQNLIQEAHSFPNGHMDLKALPCLVKKAHQYLPTDLKSEELSPMHPLLHFKIYGAELK